MLWERYVFRRGNGVFDLWDDLYKKRAIRLLYIAGRGFDIRVRSVLERFLGNLREAGHTIEVAHLLLVGFSGYVLDEELREQTAENTAAMEGLFRQVGSVESISIGKSAGGEDDISATSALRLGMDAVLQRVGTQTDVILDVSSLPRVVYLAIMTGILEKLIPSRGPACLAKTAVNFQVLVAEDASLDAQIRAEDPSNDLVLIPGFSSVLHTESVQDWPLVWFPILGENRVGQLEKVLAAAIPDSAEICPVLPHPSRNPRRADQLVLEYKRPLFDARGTPTSNILYAHESHPFEAYRQLLTAMQRYKQSMSLVGGCRLVMTPLASKLITLGAGLACFEMRPEQMAANYGVAIPYAEPTRYVVSRDALRASQPEIASLLLTGDAYA
jgi:hypothetical protein